MVDIASPNYSSRNGQKIIWIALHTTEGAMTAESLGSYFSRSSTQASSHAGCDADKVLTYVDDKYAAWTLRNGNAKSLNIEICGWAKWTRAEWLGPQYGRLVQAAKWVRQKCEQYGIPKVHIGSAGVAAGKPGIITHYDYTIGARDGSHTDPGPGFPMDVFLQLVNQGNVATEGKEEKEVAVQSFSFDPTVGADGQVFERCHTFVCPVGRVSALTKRAWISVKSANGPMEKVRLMAICGGRPDDKTWVLDKTWTNVRNDRERPNLAVGGDDVNDNLAYVDQFTLYIRSAFPYSVVLETEPR